MGEYSPHEHRPLLGYGALTAAFNGAVAAYVVGWRRSGRELPEGLAVGDFLLMAAATQKLSRVIAKDRVTSFLRSPFTRYTGEAGPSEVSEEPRGRGLRLAVGELLVCPYCVGQWGAAGVVGGFGVGPRGARAGAGGFSRRCAGGFLYAGRG